jgi:hypothetical protein
LKYTLLIPVYLSLLNVKMHLRSILKCFGPVTSLITKGVIGFAEFVGRSQIIRKVFLIPFGKVFGLTTQ